MTAAADRDEARKRATRLGLDLGMTIQELGYDSDVDEELRAELRSNWPSFSRIQRLKRMKLAVKDKLQALVAKGRRTPTPA